jgi:predicted RNase H-like HicB family nuclease
MRYMVVIEQGPESFGAYVPDLPGCIAAGETKQEVMRLIREAIQFHLEGLKHVHLEGLKHEGGSVPQPHSYSEFVEVHP